jgi:hypothetical protein
MPSVQTVLKKQWLGISRTQSACLVFLSVQSVLDAFITGKFDPPAMKPSPQTTALTPHVDFTLVNICTSTHSHLEKTDL